MFIKTKNRDIILKSLSNSTQSVVVKLISSN